MLIFEKSKAGRRCLRFPSSGVSLEIPEEFQRKKAAPLPEMSELELVRHYTRLSQKNFSVDTHFYPLGSCTMKYNPRLGEWAASLPSFRHLHPYQSEEMLQGALHILYEVEQYLKALTGMAAFTLQPAAGAHGELTSLLMIQAYFKKKGEERPFVLIPDSAHGTNPASASLAGFRTKKIRSNEEGLMDLEDLDRHLDEKVAALMITNPNTLGLFEREIQKVAEKIHQKGAFLYMDGANFNAIIGISRPSDFGVDVLHLNLHKTFSTPHGGGGPGAGPVGVTACLEPFLPKPRVVKQEGKYALQWDLPHSIGRVRSFLGSFGVALRAYCYLRLHDQEDFRNIARYALLNANYLAKKVREFLPIPYGEWCMHEFVASGKPLRQYGVRTLDVAKRLLDYGFHAPTIYFPLIVSEALMIEPTETEAKETLDEFAKVLFEICEEAKKNPELVLEAPHHLPVKRLDEVRAAKQPVVCCQWVEDEKDET